MNKLLCITALILVFCSYGSAQNLSELNSKYKKFNGSPGAYIFNEKIWFSVEKSVNGKACTLRIYPMRNLYDKLIFEEYLNAL
ncbi:MAG: hypothetical protein ABIP06_14310, partial [Pyrinomonadaceae bacterium]